MSECIFISHILKEIISLNVCPIKIFEDNQACIKMATTLESKRTKHIDVRHHFLRDLVNDHQIVLCYVPSEEQVADLFTKPLNKNKFLYFREKLNVVNV